jgi:hypothetical protein
MGMRSEVSPSSPDMILSTRLAETIGVGGDLPGLVQRLRGVEAVLANLDRAIAVYRPSNVKVTSEQVRELGLK